MKEKAEEIANNLYSLYGKEEAINICFAIRQMLKESMAERPNYKFLQEKYDLYEVVLQYVKTFK